MQHFTLRCKHCHKTYTYCTHGNDDGCSMDYCSECQTAIDEALGKIKVKFEPKFVEIKPTFGLPELLNGIKANEERKPENYSLNFPSIVCLNLPDCEYDNIEEYTHEGKTYRIAWDDDHEDDLHYFIQMEYDIEKGAVTRNVWKAEDYKDSYRKGKSAKYFMKRMCQAVSEIVSPHQCELPTGKLFYLDSKLTVTDFDWDLKLPERPKYVPKHELRTYTIDYNGRTLKRYVEDGRNCFDGKIEVAAPEGYDPEDVNEMLEYELSISKYDDENVETITNIRVK